MNCLHKQKELTITSIRDKHFRDTDRTEWTEKVRELTEKIRDFCVIRVQNDAESLSRTQVSIC
jgi:hypothetical protein